MYCPQCGAEFREGFERCNECDVPLVEKKPAGLHDAEDYVTILESSDISALPVIKSLLGSAGIPLDIRGEGLMDLFPSEALGAPLHGSAGEVEIRVPKSRAQEARDLLANDAEVEGIEPPEIEDDSAA